MRRKGSRALFWIAIFSLALLSACGNNKPPVPTLLPGVTASATPSNTPTPTFTPTPTPFAVKDAGSQLYQLTEDIAGNIASVELRPGAREALINITVTDNQTTFTRVEQAIWDGPQLQVKTLTSKLGQGHYSPDGNQIIFDGLVLTDSNGQHPQTLSTGDTGAAWSPDAKKLAFVRLTSQSSTCNADLAYACTSLILYDLTTHQERSVVTSPFLGGTPQWSPDQQWVILQRGGEAGSGVVAISLIDGTITQLVPNLNPNTPLTANGFVGATWSADSRSIIYGTADGLWRQPLTGEVPTQITNANGGSNPYSPPDQKWLYYMVPMTTDATTAPGQLIAEQAWRLDPNDPAHTVQRVLDTPIICNTVYWSLHGDTLACDGSANNHPSITLYTVQTGS